MRYTGKVKWWNEAKGFGFITPDAGGSDIFVHFTAIVGEGRRNLEDGANVEFEIEQAAKGAQAVRVERAV